MTTPDATAAMVIIGNEILSGRTQDTNLGYLARKLGERGIAVIEARFVPDVEECIIEAVDALRARATHVFTSGGIGPTHDDITAASIARAFGRAHVVDPEARRRLEAHYGDPAKLNEARLRMATIPEGACLIDNPVSAAPGFSIENVHVMAGVPRVFQAMVDGLVPTLAAGRPLYQATVAIEIGEGDLAGWLAELNARSEGVDIGSYPGFAGDRPRVSVVFRGFEEAAVDEAADLLEAWCQQSGIAYRRDRPDRT